VDEDVIFQKRLLSIISGATLPIISLGFIKSLVDYIKPQNTEKSVTYSQEEHISLESPTNKGSEKLDPENLSKIEKEEIKESSVDEIRELTGNVDTSGWAPENIEPISSGYVRGSSIEDPVTDYISKINK
jgi:hypothetical protein